MSTERSREHAINEMALTTLSEDEALRALKQANAGEYTRDDIPARWCEVFDSIEIR